MTTKPPISKLTFIYIIKAIQEQDEIDNKISKALELVGDGHYLFNSNNKKYDALILLLKEIMNDKGDYINWFLYEDVKKEVYIPNPTNPTTQTTIDVSTPSLLYDFLTTE